MANYEPRLKNPRWPYGLASSIRRVQHDSELAPAKLRPDDGFASSGHDAPRSNSGALFSTPTRCRGRGRICSKFTTSFIDLAFADIWSFYTLVGGICLDIDSTIIYTTCYYMSDIQVKFILCAWLHILCISETKTLGFVCTVL